MKTGHKGGARSGGGDGAPGGRRRRRQGWGGRTRARGARLPFGRFRITVV